MGALAGMRRLGSRWGMFRRYIAPNRDRIFEAFYRLGHRRLECI